MRATTDLDINHTTKILCVTALSLKSNQEVWLNKTNMKELQDPSVLFLL